MDGMEENPNYDENDSENEVVNLGGFNKIMSAKGRTKS
jgi:hypothetical protein